MKRTLTNVALSLTMIVTLAAPAAFASQTAMTKPKAQKTMSPRAEALKKCNDDYKTAVQKANDDYKTALKDAATKKGKDQKDAKAAALKSKNDALTAAKQAKADCIKAAPAK